MRLIRLASVIFVLFAAALVAAASMDVASAAVESMREIVHIQ